MEKQPAALLIDLTAFVMFATLQFLLLFSIPDAFFPSFF